MKKQYYLLSIILIAFMFFLPLDSQAQLTKGEIPKGTLIEKKPNTPRRAEFKGDKLIIHTDSDKKTGMAYQVEYKVTWTSATTFNLSSPLESRVNMNEEPGTAKEGEKMKTDFFGYSYLKNWSLTKNEVDEFTLESETTKDYRWVFTIQ